MYRLVPIWHLPDQNLASLINTTSRSKLRRPLLHVCRPLTPPCCDDSLVIPPLDHVLVYFRLVLPPWERQLERQRGLRARRGLARVRSRSHRRSFQDMDGGHHHAGAAVCRKAGPCWRWGGEVREVQARRTETYFMPVAQHGWLVGRHDASDQGRPSREPPTFSPTRLGLGQQRKGRGIGHRIGRLPRPLHRLILPAGRPFRSGILHTLSRLRG